MDFTFPQGASISFLVLGQVKQYIVYKTIQYPQVEKDSYMKHLILTIQAKKSIKVIQGHCASNLNYRSSFFSLKFLQLLSWTKVTQHNVTLVT